MKISIITVCYNSAETITDTIASVASQQYSNREHIIVDGASRDGTMEIVKHAPSVTRFVSEPDRGIYDAMNKGLKLATGDVIGLLNADDFYADDTILSQVAEVFKDPDVQACYADLVYVDQRNTSRVIRYWKSRDFEPGLFKRGWMPAHPTVFVRSDVYKKLGVFNLDYKIAADFELMLRFFEIAKIDVRYLPSIFVCMRLGGETNKSISNILKQNGEIIRLLRSTFNDFSLLRFLFGKLNDRIRQFFAKPIQKTN